MKTKFICALSFFILFNNLSIAHPYFFAYAELEFNELNQSIELTIISSAHDVERGLKGKNLLSNTIANAKADLMDYSNIQGFLNQHFSIEIINPLLFENQDSSSTTRLNFELEDFQVLLNGDVQFYLSSKISQPIHKFYVTFDLLMDEYPEQQNKITFRYRGKKTTHNFINSKRIQIINLEP